MTAVTEVTVSCQEQAAGCTGRAVAYVRVSTAVEDHFFSSTHAARTEEEEKNVCAVCLSSLRAQECTRSPMPLIIEGRRVQNRTLGSLTVRVKILGAPRVWENVVFVQDGEEAAEVLELIDVKGEEAGAYYLAEWHSCGNHETREEPSSGNGDYVWTDGEFHLSYSVRYGYVGLEHIHRDKVTYREWRRARPHYVGTCQTCAAEVTFRSDRTAEQAAAIGYHHAADGGSLLDVREA